MARPSASRTAGAENHHPGPQARHNRRPQLTAGYTQLTGGDTHGSQVEMRTDHRWRDTQLTAGYIQLTEAETHCSQAHRNRQAQ